MDTENRQSEPELREGYAVTFYPVRWHPYKPTSEQFRKGRKGRWQQMGDYGGWTNCEKPPVIVPHDQIDGVMAQFSALALPTPAQGDE